MTEFRPSPDLDGFEKIFYEMIVLKMPFDEFSFSDIHSRYGNLDGKLDGNDQPDAHIRSTLQSLEKKGYLELLFRKNSNRKGEYKRLKVVNEAKYWNFISHCSKNEFIEFQQALTDNNVEKIKGMILKKLEK